MKILQIIYSLSPGGAERFVIDLSNQLAKSQKNDLYLLTLKDDTIDNNSFYFSEISSRVKYLNLKNNFFSLKHFFQLFFIIRNIKPDVVHLHLPKTPLLCLFSILFYRKPLYIETLHNKAEEDYKTKYLYLIKKFLYKKRYLKICSISHENSLSFERYIKLKCDGLIYNGRSSINKSPDFISVKNEIKSLKSSNKTLVLSHIGRCNYQKNQFLLIESFNKIISEGHDVILLIIGSGYNSELGRSLKNASCEKVFFLNERINVVDYLLCSDGFCLSSLYEGMPITLIEAFACGIVPISTPVSGSIDLIKHGINGFISGNYSVESYSESLREFILKNESIDKSVLIDLFKSNLSMDICAQKYMALYSKNIC